MIAFVGHSLTEHFRCLAPHKDTFKLNTQPDDTFLNIGLRT